MSALAVVDDRDSSFQFSDSGWVRAGIEGRDFSGTSTFAMPQGASATFGFTGSSVSVYGTLNHFYAANMSFRLDGGGETVLTLQQMPERGVSHQSVLYQSGTIAEGPHTLTITQDTAFRPIGAIQGSICLDYITYMPSSDTPRSGLRYLVDDRDPQIQYGLNWVPRDFQFDFTMQTLTQSNVEGSSFEFDFNGTGVSMFGPVISESAMPRVEISLDDGTPSVFSPSLPSGSIEYGQEIFSVDNIPQGSHKMVVTLTNSNTFSYDYILVLPGADATTTMSAASSTADNSTSSPSSENTRGRDNVLAGAIAGGIAGGLAIFTAVFLGIFWCRRRRRVHNQSVPYDPPESYFQAEPFQLPVSHPQGSISIVQDSIPSSSARETTSGTRVSSPSYGIKTQVYLRPPEESVVRNEEGLRDRDSGWRSSTAGDAPRLPPDYTAD